MARASRKNGRVGAVDVEVGGVLRSRLKADGTDESTLFLAELARVQAAGGTWILPSGTIRVDSQIVFANDAAASYPSQKNMKWQGAGAYSDPNGQSPRTPSGSGGTVLDLRYPGGGTNQPKILTTGRGLWESTGITYTDLGTSSNPFIKTTNTALHHHDNAYLGNPTKHRLTCDQDALILGGTAAGPIAEGSPNPDSGFQGYGTVIRDNYFGRIRRAVYGQTYFNGNVISDNTVWSSCGSNLTNGAAIELNGGGTYLCVGNVISGNLIELVGYPYGIKLDWAISTTLAFNNFFDPFAGTTLGCIAFVSAFASANIVYGGFYPSSDSIPLAVQLNGGLTEYNTIIDSRSGGAGQTSFSTPVYTPSGITTRAPGGATSGQITFTPPNGAIAPVVFKAYGRTWGFSDTTGGPLSIDTGTGGSNLDMRAFRLRFLSYASGNDLLSLRTAPHNLAEGALQFNSSGPIWTSCANSPEGTVTAPVGSLCTSRAGGAGTTLYVKESGTGNTGWVAK